MTDALLEELKPPVAMAGLIGAPQLHAAISQYLLKEQKPPVASVSLSKAADLAAVLNNKRITNITNSNAKSPPKAPNDKAENLSSANSLLRRPLFGSDSSLFSSSPDPPRRESARPSGIIKSGWLSKHASVARPAVAVLMMDRDAVFGDPGAWAEANAGIDAVRLALKGRATKLILVILQPTAAVEISDDRLAPLRKRAEIDAKNLLVYTLSDAPKSVAKLGKAIGEQAQVYYREEAHRVKAKLGRQQPAPELAIRHAFKISTYAEFRQDWPAALKYHSIAYGQLRELATMDGRTYQQLVEAKAVAERINLKLCALLLLHTASGSAAADCIAQFRRHVAAFRHLAGPHNVAFKHHTWMSQQYKVMGELLQTSAGNGSLNPFDREHQPAFYYHAAGRAAIERRRLFEASAKDVTGLSDVFVGSEGQIGPPLYIGQAPRLLFRGSSADTQRPSDAEFIAHAIIHESNVPHSTLAIELLSRAYDQYRRLRAGRVVHYLASEMAREHLRTGDHVGARRLFEGVAPVYRREGWAGPLWAALEALRECARRLGMAKEYLEYSLEMSALSEARELPVRAAIQQTAMALLSDPHASFDGLSIASETASPSSALEFTVTESSPLRSAFSCTAAFHQVSTRLHAALALTVALRVHMPLPMPLSKLEVLFNQPGCNVTLRDRNGDDVGAGQGGDDIDLVVSSHAWWTHTIQVTPMAAGRLECVAIVLWPSPHASLRWPISDRSVASEEQKTLLLQQQQSGSIMASPFKDTDGAIPRQVHAQVGNAEPLVSIDLSHHPPALVGEAFPVRISARALSASRQVRAGSVLIEIKATLLNSANNAVAGVTASGMPRVDSLEGMTGESLSPRIAQAKEGEEASAAGVQLLTDALMPFASIVSSSTSTSASASAFSASSSPSSPPAALITLPDIAPGAVHEECVYLRWRDARHATFSVKVRYGEGDELDGANQRREAPECVATIPCEEPFAAKLRILAPFRSDSLLPSPSSSATAVPVNETCALAAVLQSMSTPRLQLLNAAVDIAPGFSLHQSAPAETTRIAGVGSAFVRTNTQQETSSSSSSDCLMIMQRGETYNSLFHVRTHAVRETPSVGSLIVKWKRADESADTAVTTRLPLPMVAVMAPPLTLAQSRPAYALLGRPFTLTLTLQNHTALLQEVAVTVVDAAGFVFVGERSCVVSVLPHETQAVSYRLVAVAAGMLLLPELRVSSLRYNARFQPSNHNRHMYVYPQEPKAPGAVHKQAVPASQPGTSVPLGQDDDWSDWQASRMTTTVGGS